MIFKFRLVSDEVAKFKREIKIDADATFYDLKDAICDSVGYDKNQMCSFFLCDDGWEKGREITLEDMGLDASEDAYLMDECVLRDFIEDDGQKMLFVFDYMTDRSFFLEMKESEPGKTLMEPLCTLSLGNPPPSRWIWMTMMSRWMPKPRLPRPLPMQRLKRSFMAPISMTMTR